MNTTTTGARRAEHPPSSQHRHLGMSPSLVNKSLGTMGASKNMPWFPLISFLHRSKLATSEQLFCSSPPAMQKQGEAMGQQPACSHTWQSLSSPLGTLTWLPASSDNKLLCFSETCPTCPCRPALGLVPLSPLCPQLFLPLDWLLWLSRPQIKRFS